jgi:hypothetical protein
MADSARDRAIEVGSAAIRREAGTTSGGEATKWVFAAAVVDALVASPEVLRALIGTTAPPADDRCPSCEHRREYHSEPGCWYAVSIGTVGKPMNCNCGVVDWPCNARASS